VRSRLSQLRQEIGAERLRSGPNGYVLNLIDGDELDAEVFQREVAAARSCLADGDPASAFQATARAVARWRGTPLAGLEDSPWAREAAAQLSELRATALELDLEARLATGEPDEVAGSPRKPCGRSRCGSDDGHI
jgi:DNA-binding SARP family transcriptional activator